MKPKSSVFRGKKQAYKKADELGKLTPQEPASRGVDGAQLLGPHQVYVTLTGTVFHPVWCNFVGHKWDDQPKNLLVVAASGVGLRRQCQDCHDRLGG